MWYRVVETGFPDAILDRELPNFNNESGVDQQYYYYPLSATTDYWNSGTTNPGPAWSLAITRTSSEMGTTTGMTQPPSASTSGYTSYASREFNGAKRFFGFNGEQRAVGFLWHQDNYTQSSYSDMFMPGTTYVDIPDLMWHRKVGVLPGQGITSGHRFVDKGSEVKYDNASKSRYTLLKDGPDVNAITVGRVYFDLKLIIITDQELLAAMTYKNNRNWTLPTPTVELKDTHPEGSSAEPWIQAGKTYFFSYYFSSQSYADDTSYGYNRTAPFQNWVRVDGKNTPDGGKYFPSITFKPDGFPYMRRGTEMESFSGTGWNANVMQILVTEMDNSASGFTGADTVRPQYWTAVTNALGGSNTNGVYVGEAGDDTIDPTYMGTRTFTLKRSDMSALNFDIEGNAPYFVISSAHTSHMDYQNGTGLTFGNETFFNGNVQTTVGLKTEKAVATVSVSKDELNYSRYGGFTSAFNESTYITEVGLLNDQNQLMAVGKPTYPIRKNAARHLIFQLEIDV